MKRILYILFVVTTLVSCSQRKVIPDRELTQIFRDAYLVNAFTTVRSVNLDSLNIYEPIFESYGYTVEDVQYTIGNFSKRKSARLSDIVEGAIVILEREGEEYAREVAILDTVRSVTQRKERRVIYTLDSLLVNSKSDSTKLKISISPIEVGDYELTFDYLIDSQDKNVGAYRTLMWFTKEDGAQSAEREVRHQEGVSYLQRGKVLTYTREVKAVQEYSAMILELVNFMGKEKTPHLKLRDIKLYYTPPAEDAEKIYFERNVNLNIFSDEFFAPISSTSSL